eukprot:TRINITY_DN346_c1_g6_i1.p1 TRINITY_DN346_c1_g6~~TRINITY_DN346_c1_g6_i1.p1  ORF type:complete len:217 (+),score=68.15 TRINITY_DN346_c1_g6_i1:263-913(+)
MFSTSWMGGGNGLAAPSPQLQKTGMLSREQLLIVFKENSVLLDQPGSKERIKAGVKQGRPAEDITTELQEELLESMGIDPKFGIQCLGRVSTLYQNDRELMTKFFEFVAKEELACDEAELPFDQYRQKMAAMEQGRQQQAQMLQALRQQTPEQQRAFLQQLQAQGMRTGGQGTPSSAMTPQEVMDFFQQQNRQQQQQQQQQAPQAQQTFKIPEGPM